MTGDWRGQAACAGLTPDQSTQIFFDCGRQTQLALAYCDSCPVRQECYDFATANQEAWGVFGGETQEARRARLGLNKGRTYYGDLFTPVVSAEAS